MTIPIVLVVFTRRRRDLPFPWMFWMFGAFIIGCGTTHLMEVITSYTPVYRLSGLVKLLTAGISLATALALVPLVPKALSLRSHTELEKEIQERKRTEESFRALLEAAPDAMVIVDQTGRITLVNQQTEAMFGYSRRELLGQPVEVLMPERFQARHTQHRDGYLAKPAVRPMGAGLQLFGKRKDGQEFPVEISLSPLAAGDSTKVISAIRDISQRRRAEGLLRQTQERLNLLVEAVKDYAIFMLDPEGNVLSWNAGAEHIKGYRAAEIIGRHFSCFFLPEEIQQGKPQTVLHIAAAAGRFEEEGWRLRKDGSRFWANVILSPVRDQTGQLLGFAKVTRDLTEGRQAEEIMRQSNRDLQDFATVASHDLQEPLRKIQTFGDLLASKAGPLLGPDGRDCLERMQNAATRMRHLIDGLLEYSRLATKPAQFVPLDLGRVAREVVSDLEGRLHAGGGRVEVGALPTLEAEPTQMRQLLQNLIGNALKFHRPEVPPVVKIEGRLAPAEHMAAPDARLPSAAAFYQITVQDNGIGIDENSLERIFGLFHRLHGRFEYEGTGIGLAICRKIVERHGGIIRAESKPGQGATFTVFLPANQAKGERSHESQPGTDHHPDGR